MSQTPTLSVVESGMVGDKRKRSDDQPVQDLEAMKNKFKQLVRLSLVMGFTGLPEKAAEELRHATRLKKTMEWIVSHGGFEQIESIITAPDSEQQRVYLNTVLGQHGLRPNDLVVVRLPAPNVSYCFAIVSGKYDAKSRMKMVVTPCCKPYTKMSFVPNSDLVKKFSPKLLEKHLTQVCCYDNMKVLYKSMKDGNESFAVFTRRAMKESYCAIIIRHPECLGDAKAWGKKMREVDWNATDTDDGAIAVPQKWHSIIVRKWVEDDGPGSGKTTTVHDGAYPAHGTYMEVELEIPSSFKRGDGLYVESWPCNLEHPTEWKRFVSHDNVPFAFDWYKERSAGDKVRCRYSILNDLTVLFRKNAELRHPCRGEFIVHAGDWVVPGAVNTCVHVTDNGSTYDVDFPSNVEPGDAYYFKLTTPGVVFIPPDMNTEGHDAYVRIQLPNEYVDKAHTSTRFKYVDNHVYTACIPSGLVAGQTFKHTFKLMTTPTTPTQPRPTTPTTPPLVLNDVIEEAKQAAKQAVEEVAIVLGAMANGD